jgi:hypothetical protein
MNTSMLYTVDALVIALVMAVLMVLFTYSGNLVARQFGSEETGEKKSIHSWVQTFLYTLLSLLLAVTFGMSESRFDARRANVVQEANDIGSARSCSDLYSDSLRDAFRADFKRYIDYRIEYYEAGRNEDKVLNAFDSGGTIALHIWSRAAALSKQPQYLAASNQMLPAINTMTDIATARHVALNARVPDTIILMLFAVALACSFLGGYFSRTMKGSDWLVMTGFALLTAFVLYITLDLDRPRRGLINVSTAHEAMYDLRK